MQNVVCQSNLFGDYLNYVWYVVLVSIHIQRYAALRYAALRCAVLRCAVLRCAALRCAALHAMLSEEQSVTNNGGQKGESNVERKKERERERERSKHST
jgi:hypothetical protein